MCREPRVAASGLQQEQVTQRQQRSLIFLLPGSFFLAAFFLGRFLLCRLLGWTLFRGLFALHSLRLSFWLAVFSCAIMLLLFKRNNVEVLVTSSSKTEMEFQNGT
jgi:hypothetical protein